MPTPSRSPSPPPRRRRSTTPSPRRYRSPRPRDRYERRRYSREPSPDRYRRRRRHRSPSLSSYSSPSSYSSTPSPRRRPRTPSTPSEESGGRDIRTVFVHQLAPSVRENDLYTFFRSVGEVRDVRLVTDRYSSRHKSAGYVEFYEVRSVQRAVRLSGDVLCGVPLVVKACVEAQNNQGPPVTVGWSNRRPLRPAPPPVFPVQKLVTVEELKRLLNPNNLPVVALPPPRRPARDAPYSRPYLASAANEHSANAITAVPQVPLPIVGDVPAELDEGKDGGLQMNASQRLMLMQTLSRGETLGAQLEGDVNRLKSVKQLTHSLLLCNMFDPKTELSGFERELAEDVRDECITQYGPVLHLHVEIKSHGVVYVRFKDISSSQKAQGRLNGRWFGGKRIQASYVPDEEYATRFPRALR